MLSFNNYVSGICCVPGTVLSPSNEQNRQNPVPRELPFWWLFLLPGGLLT